MCLLTACDAKLLIDEEWETVEEDWDKDMEEAAILAAGGVVEERKIVKIVYTITNPNLGQRDGSLWRFFCWERWHALITYLLGIQRPLNNDSQDELSKLNFI